VTATIIGYVAGALTTISFVPQAIKVIRTKDTHGISLWMYVIFVSGISFWLLFGVLTGSWQIIIPNCVTLTLALTILAMKIIYK
jgi:MtN3 and saliva related transmembrane protein